MKTTAFEKSYGRKTVLRCPALELPEGQVTAVIGANGSGKSTLARVLAGIERADGGSRALSSVRAGYLPQKPYAFRMSTARNIALNGADAQRQAQLMDDLLLTPLAKQRAKRLSGGETQKMALARLLMGQYDLLILDEPTAAMDMESTLVSERLILEAVRRTGCAALLITHSVQQARRCADRALFLHGGAVKEQGDAKTLLHTPHSEETKRFLAFYGL
jgi:ABC-type multidrug transport system ATPase subunit